MAKPVRNMRRAEADGVWLQSSRAEDAGATGFSEHESGYTASEERGLTGLTRRQRALRKTLLKSSATPGRFSVEDGIEVALDSLRRSSTMVEEMVGHSATTWRQFDLRSRRLDEQLRRNREQLAALLGDER